MRIIDADALINTLNEKKIKFNADVNYFILNAPTIDADEPRARGKWLTDLISYWTEPDEIKQFKCSVCKKGGMFTDNERVKVFKYCSYCGARMEGVKE